MAIEYSCEIDWDGDGSFASAYADVSADVDTRNPLIIEYGRDQARALGPIAAGRATITLHNRHRRYSPDNNSSPIAAGLLPGRRVRISAELNTVNHTLYQGYIDDYVVDPVLEQSSATFPLLDDLGRFTEKTLSTRLYEGLQTGTAIGLVLDAIGWTGGRDIDRGATSLRWWWVEGADALTAINQLLAAEGVGALAYIGADGEFVFRDRNHRLLRTESTTVQATYRDAGTEPLYNPPVTYNIGWKDIINSVSCTVPERAAERRASVVWSDEEAVYKIAAGETLVIPAAMTEPVLAAADPVAGRDYTVVSGAVTVQLSRRSGQSIDIRVTATTAAVVHGMQIVAYKVPVVRQYKLEASDTGSITTYGLRSISHDTGLAGVHDAQAIITSLVNARANRLPTVYITIKGINDTRLEQQLSRDLSDRVRIIEPETGLDGEFFIEYIKHSIAVDGVLHETVFGCEQAPAQVPDVFVLDTSLLDTGRLGYLVVNSDDVFILDDPTQGVLDAFFLGY